VPRVAPRRYQLEAARWALSRRRAVVCMPTGTGKTLIAGLWIERLLSEGKARRVLVLEPTRFMVEQAAQYLREEVGLDARPLHGSLPHRVRMWAAGGRVVVATPEILASDSPPVRVEEFDAIVVDECHHTTGEDAYAVVMRRARAEWRLGLTAFVPPSRRWEVEELVGEVRCWGWDDPEIRPYIPPWVGEVYEAPLNDEERRLYEEIERLWEQASGPGRAVLGNALRWLARDGAMALRESYVRGGALRRMLSAVHDLIWSRGVRPLHKLGALERALRDHEGFEKALVFVERVSVAEELARRLSHLNPVLLLGRRRVDPREALERARSGGSRLVIATSAGEEGIDLPEVDLLVVWSNTASPLRFVQRLGRALRATGRGGRQRWVVFIATPDTVDVDSLLDGILAAREAGVEMGVSEEAVSRLIGLSRRRRVLEVIAESPAPEDVVARALGAPLERVREALRWLAEKGLAVYIYTPLGRVYAAKPAIGMLRERFPESMEPGRVRVEATIVCEGPGWRIRGARSLGEALERALRAMRRRGGCRALTVTVMAWLGGRVEMRNLRYSFPVYEPEVMEAVLRNAFSAPWIAGGGGGFEEGGA
jgi:superfamily II DNA or RNA helicase